VQLVILFHASFISFATLVAIAVYVCNVFGMEAPPAGGAPAGASPPVLVGVPAADAFGPAARIAVTEASMFWTPVAALVVVPRIIAAANASSRAGAPEIRPMAVIRSLRAF
jgi:hypothetical protein